MPMARPAGQHTGAYAIWKRAPAAPPQGPRTATIESKTNFFAPIPKGDTARAVTTPLHIGRSTIVMQTNITRSDGKLARDRDTDADRAAARRAARGLTDGGIDGR